MKTHEQTLAYLKTLSLQGVVQGLDEIINDAESRKVSYLAFLNAVFSAEIDFRIKRRVERNMTGAHFPVTKKLEDFDFGRVKGIGRSEVANLLDCRWVDTKQNLLFFGPPGIGKTHLAIAFGRTAVEKGYKVCFERVTNLIKLLKTAEVQKTSEYRIRRIMKSELIVIDEIGYTPIEKREANLFFNMISELYEKVSLIVTSNKSFESWAEMMGDSVLTTALLDRLLHHARVFTLDGESYRIKKSRKEV
ncbi:MAG: IS21-like element helper ATPase IstB [Candidatus Aminicenantes bacterium]|nr:IS21-like element helper ATPase IstB [Candidatus Aminicenantes bacterium]